MPHVRPRLLDVMSLLGHYFVYSVFMNVESFTITMNRAS